MSLLKKLFFGYAEIELSDHRIFRVDMASLWAIACTIIIGVFLQ